MQYLLSLLILLFMWCRVTAAAEFILDPGHSPSKPGAESCSGGQEYQYNDRLVATIRRALAQEGINCDITRNPKGDVSLHERARMARGHLLFLSIHHDSAQPQFVYQINGHPCSEKAQGFAIFVSGKNRYFEESKLYAQVLGRLLVQAGLQPSTHHGEPIKGENRPLLDDELGIYQFDDLVVLKGADAPAILLEAAVIIHKEDDLRAKSVEYQALIAAAIVQTFQFVRQTVRDR